MSRGSGWRVPAAGREWAVIGGGASKWHILRPRTERPGAERRTMCDRLVMGVPLTLAVWDGHLCARCEHWTVALAEVGE